MNPARYDVDPWLFVLAVVVWVLALVLIVRRARGNDDEDGQ